MEDAVSVELFIHKKKQEGLAAFSIADSLLKNWSKNGLTMEGQLVCGRFCLLNGFFASVLEVLKQDLVSNRPLCWPLVFEVVKRKDRTLIKAFVEGAQAEKNMVPLALAALFAKDVDPQWKNILETVLTEKESDYQNLKIAAKIPVQSVVKRAPVEDEIQIRLKHIKEKLSRHEASLPTEETPTWPGLESALKEQSKDWDLISCTELATALHVMGYDRLAIKVLGRHKKSWTEKQKLLQIDFLLSDECFVEGLEESEKLMKDKSQDPEIILSCLYNMALANIGLKNISQALDILKGIAISKPDYRNIQNLIKRLGAKI